MKENARVILSQSQDEISKVDDSLEDFGDDNMPSPIKKIENINFIPDIELLDSDCDISDDDNHVNDTDVSDSDQIETPLPGDHIDQSYSVAKQKEKRILRLQPKCAKFYLIILIPHQY